MYEPTPGKAFHAWEANRNANVRQALAKQLRSTPRKSYEWQVLRQYVNPNTGDIRSAQLMAGSFDDCRSGAAQWAKATGEEVEVLRFED